MIHDTINILLTKIYPRRESKIVLTKRARKKIALLNINPEQVLEDFNANLKIKSTQDGIYKIYGKSTNIDSTKKD